VRSSRAAALVAHHLLAVGQPTYGLTIGRATGVQSGTYTNILRRFLDAGWITAYDETGDPRLLGRPLRRYYRVSNREALAEYVRRQSYPGDNEPDQLDGSPSARSEPASVVEVMRSRLLAAARKAMVADDLDHPRRSAYRASVNDELGSAARGYVDALDSHGGAIPPVEPTVTENK
jgi:DNA-binding PadR family transcriptional regulator